MIGGFMLSNEHIYGYSQYKKLKIGDLISWPELNQINGLTTPEKIKRFGVITSLYIVYRSDRKVAIVKVLPLTDKESNSSEREILAICVEIVNKTKESSVV